MGRRVMLLTCVSLLGIASPQPARAASGGKVSGSVFYEQRDCFGAAERRYDPIVGALLEVKVGARTYRDTLDAKGRYTVKAPRLAHHHGDLKAQVVFADAAMTVAPDPAVTKEGDNPYAIEIDVKPGQNGKVVLVREGEAGTANVWDVLHLGSAYAKANAPARIAKVRVLMKYTHDFNQTVDVGASDYTPEEQTIRVRDSATSIGKKSNWEPFTLLHEYGHHVQNVLAPFTGDSGGQHYIDESYPRRPGLAYAEGFAHAFAANVLKTTDLGYECKPFLHLGDDAPDPRPELYAQYAESPAGWVFYRLFARFGFKRVTQALMDYRASDGGHAKTMRGVRDALATKLERDAAEDVFDNQLFLQAGMAWGFAASVRDTDPDLTGIYAKRTGIEVYVENYTPCHSTAPDPDVPLALGASWTGAVGPGALDFTFVDDCLSSADRSFVALDYPILPGAAQDQATFYVKAKYVCEPGEDPGQEAYEGSDTGGLPYDPKYWQCAASRRTRLRFVDGDSFTLGGDGTLPATPDPLVPGQLALFSIEQPDFVVSASGTLIAIDDAYGRCSLFDNSPCSV